MLPFNSCLLEYKLISSSGISSYTERLIKMSPRKEIIKGQSICGKQSTIP